MKRERNLIERVAAMDNLLLAIHKAQKGKLCKKEVVSFRDDLQANLLLLREGLRLRHKTGVYTGLLESGRWTQAEYRDHITPLFAFAEHAYTKKLRQRIITEVESRRAPTASIAAAAGTTTPGTAAYRTATTTLRRTARTTSVSGLFWSPSLATADGVGTVNRLSSSFCTGQNETSGFAPSRRGNDGSPRGCVDRSLCPCSNGINNENSEITR